MSYRRAPKWKREEFLSSDRERMESDVTVSGDSVYVVQSGVTSGCGFWGLYM